MAGQTKHEQMLLQFASIAKPSIVKRSSRYLTQTQEQNQGSSSVKTVPNTGSKTIYVSNF